jgi:prefoldin subunit 5
MLIVLCVERVIILTVGKARLMSTMRVMLALCMAVLGSCIFDQIIFSNDIQQTIQDRREDVILETTNKRLMVFDSDIQRITHDMDSLGKDILKLNEELKNNPTIDMTDVSTTRVLIGNDENGNPVYQTSTNVNKRKMPNPMANQLNANNDQIQLYQNQLEQLRQDKKEIAGKVAIEIHSRPVGFIEELEATLKVVSNSWASLVFYVILFCFLAFLELFVLTIKMGETKCDYELIVENQLKLKKVLMEQTSQSLIVNKAA